MFVSETGDVSGGSSVCEHNVPFAGSLTCQLWYLALGLSFSPGRTPTMTEHLFSNESPESREAGEEDFDVTKLSIATNSKCNEQQHEMI